MIFHQAGNSLSNYNYNTAFYTDEVWEHHFHKNPEIIYVLEGAVDCTADAGNIRLAAGEFGLCLPYEIHSYRPLAGSRYWVIVFSEDFVRLFAVIGIMVICCMAILAWLISKIRIAQALKLGED